MCIGSGTSRRRLLLVLPLLLVVELHSIHITSQSTADHVNRLRTCTYHKLRNICGQTV